MLFRSSRDGRMGNYAAGNRGASLDLSNASIGSRKQTIIGTTERWMDHAGPGAGNDIVRNGANLTRRYRGHPHHIRCNLGIAGTLALVEGVTALRDAGGQGAVGAIAFAHLRVCATERIVADLGGSMAITRRKRLFPPNELSGGWDVLNDIAVDVEPCP